MRDSRGTFWFSFAAITFAVMCFIFLFVVLCFSFGQAQSVQEMAKSEELLPKRLEIVSELQYGFTYILIVKDTETEQEFLFAINNGVALCPIQKVYQP